MKKSIIAIGIVGMLTVGLGVSALASDSAPAESNTESNKTKITYIEKLINEGKTFEEAKEEAMQKKFSNIDAAVTEGKLSTEDANEKKENIKEKLGSVKSIEEFKSLRDENRLNKDSRKNCNGPFKKNGKNFRNNRMGNRNCDLNSSYDDSTN